MSSLRFDLPVALQAFVAVFPAELPDKSMFATLGLAARFGRKGPVWCGVVAAFAMHMTIATAIGGLFAQRPPRLVAFGAAVLFAIGAVLIWREARSAGVSPAEITASRPSSALNFGTIAWSSFGVLALAELGDLTQFAVAGVAARSGEPLSAGVGGWMAAACVAGIAVTAGSALLKRFSVKRIQLFACLLFACLAVASLAEAVTS